MKKQSHLLLLLLTAVSGACRAQAAAPGTVVVWGYNHGVRNVPPGLTNVTAIAAGPGHAVALKSDGSVVAWGYNDYGQTDVPSGLSNVTAISAGGACPYDCGGSSVALRSDGTVVAWGLSPDVPAGLTNVTAIAAGLLHTVAIIGYPPPVPTLEARAMGHELILSWSTNAVGFTVQSTPDLTPPATWIDFPAAPSVIGGQFNATTAFSNSAQFFRLRKL